MPAAGEGHGATRQQPRGSVRAADLPVQSRGTRVRKYRVMAAVAGGALATVVVAGLLRSWRASDLSPPINLPPGFTADVFAAGLGSPRSLAVDPAGTLIVSIPSRGQVVALRDRGGGGAVEVVTLAERLHLPYGLAFRHGALYVA